MVKASLSVIIPSRSQPRQLSFLSKSIMSIRKQTIIDMFDIEIIIGVDKGYQLPLSVLDELGAQCVESEGMSQAAALNAALNRAKGNLIAFIEDDDQWSTYYLECAVQALEDSDFVSTTQVEYNEDGELLRINDFPTPSGWIMHSRTLMAVGPFNEEFKFHLDCEWLGRLRLSGLKRTHLMESTAPIIDIKNIRPMLMNLLLQSSQLRRHFSPMPLVSRLVHGGSGMYSIGTDDRSKKRSIEEKNLLISMYGNIPW